MGFPGKNTGMGCHFPLQGIFRPREGSNLSLLRLLQWQADSLPLSHLGSPIYIYTQRNIIQPSNKKEILPFVTTWVNLEGAVLSKISPSQKDE